MSSSIRKVQNRIDLKNENKWLRAAFRNAVSAFTEQQENGADLASSLWLLAQQNGGEVRIKTGASVDTALGSLLPAGAKLRSTHDAETGETVYIAHIEPTIQIIDEETEIDEAVVGAIMSQDTTEAQPSER